MKRVDRERLLVDRAQLAAGALGHAPPASAEWAEAFEKWKRCRDDALHALSRPLRRPRRRAKKRKET